MSAEPIAQAVADLRTSRVRSAVKERGVSVAALLLAQQPSQVVDATAIYHSLVAKDEPVNLYGDHPCIAPPFEHALICYVNEHGNVVMMDLSARDRRRAEQGVTLAARIDAGTTHEGWTTAGPVDWDRVRWELQTFVWIGGHGGDGKQIPVTGPMHCWRFAVYETGEPADLHWINLVPEYPMENWDMAHLVLLGALNFLNCFAAETPIVTSEGIVPIGDVAGRQIEVLSRDPTLHAVAKFVAAQVRSFGPQPIVELDVERNGTVRTFRTTAGHRWFLRRRLQGKGRSQRIVEVTTADLRPGDHLVTVRPRSRAETCLISGIGAAHGIVYGDGSRNDHIAYVDLFGAKKKDLIAFFPFPQISRVGSEIRISNLPRSFKELPREDEGSSYLYSFLAGWFAADGSVGKNGNLELSCAHSGPLDWVHRVGFARLGIMTGRPQVVMRRGINGLVSPLWTIRFDRGSLAPAFFLRPHHRERYEARTIKAEPNHWKVTAVRSSGAIEEVFCAIVPGTETFVIDGMILTGNCQNVQIVEPKRSRPEVRRLARIGVQVYELTVFPVSRRSASSSGAAPKVGTPLTSVRGRFSHYGDCCPGIHEPHGLAFGRLQGRFWVPQHARGERALGVHHSDYRLALKGS